MLGDATWPEVLRRYLLFTRAGGRGAAAAAAAAAAGLPPARLDDRAAGWPSSRTGGACRPWLAGPVPGARADLGAQAGSALTARVR